MKRGTSKRDEWKMKPKRQHLCLTSSKINREFAEICKPLAAIGEDTGKHRLKIL